MQWKARVPVLAAALWWGGLTAIGAIVVPLLFATLPTPALAGQMAARLFTASTWIAIGCGALLMLSARSGPEPAGMAWGNGALVFVFAGLLLSLLAEFAAAPKIVARENLALWHGVGTAMYAGQWVCSLVVLWKIGGLPVAPPAGESEQ